MFSESELKTIILARKKLKHAKVSQIMQIIALAVLASGVYIGLFSPEKFAFLAVAFVVISIAQPQLGVGPKYEDLVNLLESKSKI